MDVARHLCEQLASARGAGCDFDTAWPNAVSRALACAPNKVEKSDWTVALQETRSAWEASYLRAPADRWATAVGVLADGDAREPVVDEPDRVVVEPTVACVACGMLIPEARRRRRARFCSRPCQRRRHRMAA